MRHAIDLRNRTSKRSIPGNKTPHEIVFCNTPDNSIFWYFAFFDPVRFTTPGAKQFPNDPVQPGSVPMVHDGILFVGNTSNKISQ